MASSVRFSKAISLRNSPNPSQSEPLALGGNARRLDLVVADALQSSLVSRQHRLGSFGGIVVKSELCDQAAAYGLHVNLEFAIYTGVRSLVHAARVVAESKRSNASVLIDALHFSRSGGLPAHVASVDPALFRYAQICDAGPDMPGPGDTPALIREARTGRLLPGEGVLPLAELIAALPATVPLAIEAPNRATADLPAVERAKRAYRALAALTGA